MMRIIDLVLTVLLILTMAPPAFAQIVVLSPATQELAVESDGTYEGEIRVRNASNEPAELRVGQSDYHFEADGTSRFESPGTRSRSNADWITPSPQEMILAPGEEGTIAYRVAVPDGSESSLRGTYWSVVFLEWIPAGDRESRLRSEREEDEQEMTIRTRIRHAVQVATHVQGTGEAEIGFSAPVVSRGEGGDAEFEVVVENRGTVGSRPQISAAVFDESGNQVGTREEQRGLLYPDTSLKQRFPLGDLSPGEYTVLLLADADGEEVFGAQYTIRF